MDEETQRVIVVDSGPVVIESVTGGLNQRGGSQSGDVCRVSCHSLSRFCIQTAIVRE